MPIHFWHLLSQCRLTVKTPLKNTFFFIFIWPLKVIKRLFTYFNHQIKSITWLNCKMALIQFVFLRCDIALCYSSCRQCVFILNCPVKVVVDFAKLGILESEILGLTFLFFAINCNHLSLPAKALF